MAGKDILVSVAVPLFNEEESVPVLYEQLKTVLDGLDVPYEIIFVDDGSSDDSVAIVENHFPTIRVLRHPVNRGKGAAVRTGVLAASGRFVFFIDADIPYSLAALEVRLDYLARKEFHL